MANFIPGLELARRFYQGWAAPRLEGTVHAAALIGDGSEVLANPARASALGQAALG